MYSSKSPKKYLFFLLLFLPFSLNADNLKKISLQLQWKYQFQFAGYIMAKEKGFYKKNGFDVEIKEWKSKIDNVDELLNNRSQYAILRPTALIDIAKGKELLFVAAIFQSSPLILLADKSSHIKSIKDFKNKKMMSTGDLHSDASLLSMMFSQGVKIEDVTIIEPSFDVRDLLNKKTDLIASYISNEPYVLKENGGTPVIFNPKEYGYDFYNDLLSVSKEYALKHPKEVALFKEATLKGWEYAFENIEETATLLASNLYNTQKKSKKALIFEGEELKKLAYLGGDLGRLEEQKLQKIYDVYKLLGHIDSKLNLNSIIFEPLSYKIEYSKEERAYLAKKKVITMCIDPNWMPFEKFDEDKNHIGMTADYYRLFKKNLQTDFQIVYTKDWSESLQKSEKRECDILSLVAKTPKRSKYLNFTTPYLSIPLVVATKMHHPFVPQIEDLKGKKLGITKGYAFVELLEQKYPYLELIEMDNLESGLQALKRGEIDGYIDTLASVAYALQQEYGGELKVAGKFDEKWELGIGVRNDDPLLFSILEKTVLNIKDDEKQAILNKWISVKYESEIDYEIVWKIIFFSFLVVAFVLYGYFKEKKLKNKLQEQKDEFETIFNNSKDGIAILDLKTHFLAFNEAYLYMTGFTKEELFQKTCVELTIPEDLEKTKIAMDEVIQKGFIKNFEKICLGKNGKRIVVNMSISLMPDKKRVLLTTKDITHLKQLASKIKLAEMGEMIGNIAHQWRQPLSVITTIASGTQLRYEYGDFEGYDLSGNMDAIITQANYLSKTIDDFRDFISEDQEMGIVNIVSVLKDTLVLLEQTLQSNQISIILDITGDCTIEGNKNELEKAFINIINNAKDAILSSKVEEKLLFITTQKTKDGEYLVEILDNGGGISNELFGRIFEPYFTTKHQSIGTGLGLTIVDNIVRNKHKQKLEIENKEFHYGGKSYKGALFKVIFGCQKLEKI